ncbi:MAG: Ig-like domain-containing protein [Verrucomicrobiota bacterium]
MNSLRLLAGCVLVTGILLSGSQASSAVTFTTNAAIAWDDPAYDGQALVVSGGTLTIDGAHTFASLQVLSGARLTHSYWSNGIVVLSSSVTNQLLVLTGTNPVSLLYSNVTGFTLTDTNAAVVYQQGLDYQLTTGPDGLAQVARIEGSSLADGAPALASYTAYNILANAGLHLVITGSATVAAGGRVDANAIGYAPGAGPGSGRRSVGTIEGSGGGYGGCGGMSSSNVLGGDAYGSFDQPSDIGSGGGPGYNGAGGAGGGFVGLTVGGTLAVQGIISANGAEATNNRSGGGSGGGVCIEAGILTGNGMITANGGSGDEPHGGGGGGGRIAVQCATNAFTGTLAACGAGSAGRRGGAGTIYLSAAGQNPWLLLDNGNLPGTNTPVSVTNGADVTVRGQARAMPALTSSAWTVGQLTVSSNSAVFARQQASLTITASGDVVIEPGGAISADTLGFLGGTGQSPGRPYNDALLRPCGGGGCAGAGGAGSSTNAAGGGVLGGVIGHPLGSGGGTFKPFSLGGSGGGSITLNVLGTLHQDGLISADGGDGSGTGGGGGSGGSISIQASTLLGGGRFSCSGGNGVGTVGGGGGGGYISIQATDNLFAGSWSAFGGAGTNAGGAGVVYIQSGTSGGDAWIDNNGRSGSISSVPSSPAISTLTIRNAGIGVCSGSSYTVSNLVIGSNGVLTLAEPVAASFNLSVRSNLVVQSGGAIVFDGKGYGPGQGQGAGRKYYYAPSWFPCSGAGHGGYGAASITNSALGGMVYDTPSAPLYAGSGGGTYSSTVIGGYGGGAIRLNVSRLAQIDGRISANGLAGSAVGSAIGGGGGSGGSVWLSAQTVAGTGMLSANGGNGFDSVSGGGGGGMVSVLCTTNQFVGNMTAYGGSGSGWGGAGTVFVQASGQNPQLILDNGGHSGTNSMLNVVQNTDVTIRNGAKACTGSQLQSVTVASLFVGSNSWILPTPTLQGPPGSLTLTVQGNATLQAGGGINFDQGGYLQGQGSGAGSFLGIAPAYPCSGAGHGAYGGNSAPSSSGTTARGGNVYDVYDVPVASGSGGGFYSIYSFGGSGGGVLHFIVNGPLQLDGSISANGGNGTGIGGGGGSGGAIWLNVGTVAGNGSVTASGGSGANNFGGGGGGGRIAFYYTTNQFTGTMAAPGGSGFVGGGAGTVFSQSRIGNSQSMLVIDNQGRSGTNTPLSSSSLNQPNLSVVVRNASVGIGYGYQTIGSLDLGPGSSLGLAVPYLYAWLKITGDMTVASGASVSFDAQGYAPGSGSSPGRFAYFNGVYTVYGGGGHGGFGGGYLPSEDPGTFYGSITNPFAPAGSGGAPSGASVTFGGRGGGVCRVNVQGKLQVDGVMSVNGTGGTGLGASGGAGGSLHILAGTLAGSGLLAANGGNGFSYTGGGGGGGRIAIEYSTNQFNGTAQAIGGNGIGRGGAGTVYWKNTAQPVGQAIIDNSGFAGAMTPVGQEDTLDLLVRNAGVAQPAAGYLVLNSLAIDDGGGFVGNASYTNLDLAVLSNVLISANGELNSDGIGFGPGAGPGAGLSAGGYGSGAGYGGVGGSSFSTNGGPIYGSALQPADIGSGGGLGLGPVSSGSSVGGGAIRLTLGGTLTVNGRLSANGNDGQQDGAGGGSGGSLWVTAAAISGNGLLSAAGGFGESFGGGGGGGGRVALYRHTAAHRTNNFTGFTTAYGGSGAEWGDDGSVLFASDSTTLRVTSILPVGTVPVVNADTITVAFNTPPLPASMASNVVLYTPAGMVTPSGTVLLGTCNYQITFAQQSTPGTYSLVVLPGVVDLYGQTLGRSYTNTFSVVPLYIAGRVTDEHGVPLPGIVLSDGRLLGESTTDNQGNYAVPFFPPGGFSVFPVDTNRIYLPRSMSYSGVSTSISNQDYIGVTSIASTLGMTSQAQSNLVVLDWQGLPGVTYQVYNSSNLVDWAFYGSSFIGSNGVIEIPIPATNGPAWFYRVTSDY